jgi:hypothetical protein
MGNTSFYLSGYLLKAEWISILYIAAFLAMGFLYMSLQSFPVIKFHVAMLASKN